MELFDLSYYTTVGSMVPATPLTWGLELDILK